MNDKTTTVIVNKLDALAAPSAPKAPVTRSKQVSKQQEKDDKKMLFGKSDLSASDLSDDKISLNSNLSPTERESK